MAWYDPSWSGRHKISTNPQCVFTEASGFPLYYPLSAAPNSFWENVKSDGSDIVITLGDGVTKLPRELVTIDASGKTGEIHFKTEGLSTVSQTSFYIYYGNPGASETNDTDVWISQYEGVWHLHRDIGDICPDSTSNGNDGTPTALVSTIDGKIGSGQYFPGGTSVVNPAQYIALDSAIDFLDDTEWGFSYWFNQVEDSNEDMSIGDTREGFSRAHHVIGGDGWSIFRIHVKDGEGGNHDFDPGIETRGSWHHVVITCNGEDTNNLRCYFNGELTADSPANLTNLTAMGIDAIGRGINFDQEYYAWNGGLDEVRVFSSSLDADWIRTEYYNQARIAEFWGLRVSTGNTIWFGSMF